ncbi:MAG: hypothetical protein SWJ54_01175, partial [Cyanobacteriota bacterium]|nr:hypothetical protein [Cyanobacteriota bacterium]
GFRRRVTEKFDTDQIIWGLLNSLIQNNIVFDGKTISIADFGCADGQCITRYTQGVFYQPGFVLDAFDANKAYTGKEGLAYKTLQELCNQREQRSMPLKDFQIHCCNIFSESLDQYVPNRNRYNVIIFSHTNYHSPGQKQTNSLIKQGLNLLHSDGILLACHAKYGQDCFQFIRTGWGSHKCSSFEVSDTPPMVIEYPSLSVTEAAKQNDVFVFELEFKSRLFFTSDAIANLNQARNSDVISNLAPNQTSLLQDLLTLAFIVQRTPIGMYSSNHWNSCIDAVLDAIEADSFHSRLPSMSMLESVQLILPKSSSSFLCSSLNQLIEDFQQKIPNLIQQGRQDFKAWTQTESPEIYHELLAAY